MTITLDYMSCVFNLRVTNGHAHPIEAQPVKAHKKWDEVGREWLNEGGCEPTGTIPFKFKIAKKLC